MILLNGFLLEMVLSDRAQAREAEALNRGALQSALLERGIALKDPAILDLKPQRARALDRDLQAEQSAVRALLGPDLEAADQGGGIYAYTGSGGQAFFHGTGTFDILFMGETPSGSDHRKVAEAVLTQLGARADPNYALSDEAAGKLTLRCALDGLPVFDCAVTFTFSGDRLLVVDGTRTLDTPAPAGDSPQLDIPTLLLRFLENIRQGGIPCAEIRGVTCGYEVNASIAGDSVLSPALCVETDAGTFFLDAATGDLLS